MLLVIDKSKKEIDSLEGEIEQLEDKLQQTASNTVEVRIKEI